MKPSLLRYILPGFVVVAAVVVFFYYGHLPRHAVGDAKYGGVLKISVKSERVTLFPLADHTLDHHRIQQLVFEPLLQPSQTQRGWKYFLANHITSLNAGKTLRIQLRKNVHFSDDPCFRFHSSELSAEDVAFSLSLACSKNTSAKQDLILPQIIEGGLAFYEQNADPLQSTVRGIRIIDNYTLEISLTGAYNHFLNVLSSPSLGILSKQAVQYYGKKIDENPVGTGPFFLYKTDKKQCTFKRNTNYWRHDRFGNQLPYLEEIQLKINVPGEDAHALFLKGRLDLLFDLPIEDLRGAFGTLYDAKRGKNPLHEIYIKPAAKVHYLQFNSTQAPFDNTNIRKAFAMAIDASTICNSVLKGEGRSLNNLLIPTTTQHQNPYLQPDNRSFSEKINEAKALLQQEGYSSMASFPKIAFYVGSKRNTAAYKWTEAVAQMLEQHIGIAFELFEQQQPLNMPAAAVWRVGWVGDYPGSESYLRLFYSAAQKQSYFKNEFVDSLYLVSVFAGSISEKVAAQHRCEKAIIDQQALLPIYTEDFIALYRIGVRNFNLNESGLLDYAKVFVKEL
jgi:ABC-type oligopeptide transport system substrate-binding subunit